MNDEMKFKVAPTLTAPTAVITPVDSKFLIDGSKCEANINVGLFFDGTMDNREFAFPDLEHSDMARVHFDGVQQ